MCSITIFHLSTSIFLPFSFFLITIHFLLNTYSLHLLPPDELQTILYLVLICLWQNHSNLGEFHGFSCISLNYRTNYLLPSPTCLSINLSISWRSPFVTKYFNVPDVAFQDIHAVMQHMFLKFSYHFLASQLNPFPHILSISLEYIQMPNENLIYTKNSRARLHNIQDGCHFSSNL